MITWLLLVSLFCISTQDNGEFHCEPQNLTLTTSDQTILSTWEDDPSCFAGLGGLIYELQIVIADNKVHHEELAVMPDQMGYTKSWCWTSYLALECAPHTVRLRARYNSLTSQWKEQTLPETEISNKPEVFPRDRVFKVGSRVTFCCIVPKGGESPKMFLIEYNDSNMNITKISSQTYTLTVDLNQPSPSSSGTDVICETSQEMNGACAYIGYAPFDSDLQCETRNLHSVECQWKVGDTHLYRNQTTYHLEGQQCENGRFGRCEAKVQVDAGERNWTLTAQNVLGKVELSDRADLMKRVHMFAPVGLKASAVHARNASVRWRWTVQQYDHLNITCQLNVSYGEINEIIEDFGDGLQFVMLNNLIPHWTYNVTVRCGAAQHFWKWSNWSTSVTFLTKGDVPDALDVWMQACDQVLVIWKTPLTNHSNGHIEDYEVTWVKTRERGQESRKRVQNQNSLALNLDPMEEYTVTVTARNVNGSSPPSVIIIPSLSSEFSEKQKRVNSSWITFSNGSFSLSWSASPAASCGYVVDWYPTTKPCFVDWLKVLPNQTTATIYSKTFREGVRYLLSVYACTQHGPVLLQRREGYVSEKKVEDGLFESLKCEQHDSAVEVSWDPIKPREQPAFIQGYVLYCLSLNNTTITRVSTDNVDATSLTVKNLNFTSYRFVLKAQTALGECGTTFVTATLNSLTDMLVKPALISLATIFVLLSIVAIVCYRHRACIKQKVCPPIPKPVLAEEWLTSLGRRNHLHMPPYHHSEADVLHVSAVNCNSLERSYISEESVQFPLSHSPKDYYSQPLMKFTPPPFTSSSTTLQSEIPSSPLRSVFTNLTYNLIMQTGHRQPVSGPEFQDTSPLERSSSGYQPQSNLEWSTDNQNPDGSHSPLTCVSAYIMLPQSNDK